MIKKHIKYTWAGFDCIGTLQITLADTKKAVTKDIWVRAKWFFSKERSEDVKERVHQEIIKAIAAEKQKFDEERGLMNL